MTNETKWTPGPWTVNHPKNPYHGPYAWSVSAPSRPDGIAGLIKEEEADLIAQAPRLYAALESLLECLGQHERLGHVRPDPRWDEARAALAAAKGER